MMQENFGIVQGIKELLEHRMGKYLQMLLNIY